MCFYTIDLILACTFEPVIGSIILKKQILLHFLHATYSLKVLYDTNTWIDLWEISTGQKQCSLKYLLLLVDKSTLWRQHYR